MTPLNNLTPATPTVPLQKRIWLGAAMGLTLILFFVLQVRHPHAEWGQYWMVKPLLITPAAGAACGAFYHFLDTLRIQYRWNKAAVVAVSLVACLIGLWMGVVLGLNGTMWN